MFEVWIVTQEFPKLTLSHRKKIITTVTYFLQPRLSLLIPAQQSFSTVADGFVGWAYIDTHVKNTQGTKRLPSSLHSILRLSYLVPQENKPPFHFRHE